MQKPKYHVFVCSSSRLNGQIKGMCASKDGIGIVEKMIELVSENDLTDDVMITNTGCLGICGKGPVLLVYPENVWYGNVSIDDVEEIVTGHFMEGQIVQRLLIG